MHKINFEFWKLTSAGLEPKVKATKYGAPNHEQVELCKQWLQLFRFKKSASYNDLSSYYYKHRVENHFGTYIANGAFIQAALELGCPVKHVNNCLNVLVGISMKDFKKYSGDRF